MQQDGETEERFPADKRFLTESGYVEYVPGNINLILSIPHDGFLKPVEIADRIQGCQVTTEDPVNGSTTYCIYEKNPNCVVPGVCKVSLNRDIHAYVVAAAVADEVEKVYGGRPHVIRSLLHRHKLDPNREIVQAAMGDPIAEKAYTEFHGSISKAKETIATDIGGRGLLIDMHGQRHGENKTELGYLLWADEMNAGDYEISKTSIRKLGQETGLSGEVLMYGDRSLGAYMEKYDVTSFPSPRQPAPGEDAFFRGGYITQVYGSWKGGDIDAIQIECPEEVRVNGQEALNNYAKAVGKAVTEFFGTWYTPVVTPKPKTEEK